MGRIRSLRPEAPAEPYGKRRITSDVRREVAKRYGSTPGTTVKVECHYCGAPGEIQWKYPGQPPSFGLTLDHVIPERHGGPGTADNIVLACKSCNCRKGDRL